MKGLQRIWETVLADIRSGVTQKEYSLWLGVLSLRDITGNTAFIAAPDRFVAEWSTDNYLESLKKSLKRVTGSVNDVIISPQSVENHQYRFKNETLSISPGKRAPSNVNPSLTFSSFISSPGNKEALVASRLVSTSQGYVYNPLFLFCKQAAGKTHLLNAIANSILSTGSLKPPLYISAEKHKCIFLNHFADNSDTISTFLLDDVEAFCLKRSDQERFTRAFDKLHRAGVQLVFAGKTLPKDIPGLIPSLRSRLEWGLLCEIKALDMETRFKILKSRSSMGVAVSDHIIKELASASNDITTCLSYLIRLEAGCSFSKKGPDIESASAIIKDCHESSREISIKDILNKTSCYFNISIEKLTSHSRSRSMSYPRHLAIFLSRNLCKTPYSEIAFIFSNRNISTILYSVKKIESMTDHDEQVRRDISIIRKMLCEKRGLSERLVP